MSEWGHKARHMYPPGTTLRDIRLRGTVDKEFEGEHHCGGNFVYLVTFPRGIDAQNTRIYLRDVMGIQNIAVGLLDERIYVNEKNLAGEVI
jgi:hypothetical protein